MTYKLICSDNIAALKEMQDGCIDLTVTSPPYDNLRTYNGFTWDFESLAKELYRITKGGGVVVWVVGDATVKGSETGTSFRQALFFKDIGFNLHDTMIYAKTSYMPLTHNRYEQAFEYMFVLSKGRPKSFHPIMIDCLTKGSTRNWANSKQKESTYAARQRVERTVVNSSKQHQNIFYYAVGQNDKTKHNAPFHEALAKDHILSWSNEGDTVLDPFMGSGTTGKMALLNNRKFVGIELSPEYMEISKARIEAAAAAPQDLI